MPRGQHFALYGNVAIQREYCASCRQYALVLDRKLACCGMLSDFDSTKTKRMSEAEDGRKRPSPEEQKAILEAQGGRCLYCERVFGSVVMKKEKLVFLKVTWDHWIPYSYSRNNYPYNFAAACQICNGLKGSLMFETVDQARAYILSLWEAKGLDDEGPGDCA
jgi:5-methylcytosine-specific restriction endonuclease McrA